MKRNYITKVISHFFRKDYPANTQNKVQHWLIEEKHLKEKEDALFELWENNKTVIDKETRRALEQTKERLGMRQKKEHMLYLRNLKVAAVLLLLLLSGGLYYFHTLPATFTYVTREGETKRIDLPDGSTVRLHAASSITYQSRGKKDKRMLALSGEACFVVASDSLRPFIVTTNTLTVEVVGTEFSVEDYPDNPNAAVTLYTGRVKIGVTDKDGEKQYYYPEPGGQFIYDPLLGIETGNSGLIFPDTSFKNIIKKLETHFNVKIIIHNFENIDDHYSVKFINGESPEQIMNILQEIAGNFTYEIID